MTLFFDTSALIKNYIEEEGSPAVVDLLMQADEVIVSEVCEIECCSVLRRLLAEKRLNREDYDQIRREIKKDFPYFGIVEIRDAHDLAVSMIDKYQLKSLDSLQLGGALLVSDQIDGFICFDKKLLSSARSEGLKTIEPDDAVFRNE